jgi:hypothetical protein
LRQAGAVASAIEQLDTLNHLKIGDSLTDSRLRAPEFATGS